MVSSVGADTRSVLQGKAAVPDVSLMRLEYVDSDVVLGTSSCFIVERHYCILQYRSFAGILVLL